jgi:hypothetical protein
MIPLSLVVELIQPVVDLSPKRLLPSGCTLKAEENKNMAWSYRPSGEYIGMQARRLSKFAIYRRFPETICAKQN